MKRVLRQMSVALLFTAIFLFATAESCSQNSGSSSGGSSGGSSTIRYDQTYEFSKVSLLYNYTSANKFPNALLSDAIEFERAHDMPS